MKLFRDIGKAMSLLRAVQKSLALRTNNVFFLNLPSLAKSSMKLFLKIYPKHIQEKIHICSGTDSLFDVLARDQIPEIFGGTMNKNKSKNNSIPCLNTMISSYIDIKNFKHLQIGDDDYNDIDEEEEYDENQDDNK